MRPEGIEVSVFERAILERMAAHVPSLASVLPKLRVLNREFTGAGSYTALDCPVSISDSVGDPIVLRELINMPGVPDGMGAALHIKDGVPKSLEIFTFGVQSWGGVSDGFSFG
jgi:hypothetical protein